jgi:hypothetical protein
MRFQVEGCGRRATKIDPHTVTCDLKPSMTAAAALAAELAKLGTRL